MLHRIPSANSDRPSLHYPPSLPYVGKNNESLSEFTKVGLWSLHFHANCNEAKVIQVTYLVNQVYRAAKEFNDL